MNSQIIADKKVSSNAADYQIPNPDIRDVGIPDFPRPVLNYQTYDLDSDYIVDPDRRLRLLAGWGVCIN